MMRFGTAADAERFITGAALLINTTFTFVELSCRNIVVVNVVYHFAHSKVTASVMHCAPGYMAYLKLSSALILPHCSLHSYNEKFLFS